MENVEDDRFCNCAANLYREGMYWSEYLEVETVPVTTDLALGCMSSCTPQNEEIWPENMRNRICYGKVSFREDGGCFCALRPESGSCEDLELKQALGFNAYFGHNCSAGPPIIHWEFDDTSVT